MSSYPLQTSKQYKPLAVCLVAGDFLSKMNSFLSPDPGRSRCLLMLLPPRRSPSMDMAPPGRGSSSPLLLVVLVGDLCRGLSRPIPPNTSSSSNIISSAGLRRPAGCFAESGHGTFSNKIYN